METDLRFRALRPWLLERYGRPVHRVALDAGSTCPNRDGTKGFGGCTYCDVEGSGTGALRSGSDLTAQLEAGIRRIALREPNAGVIAYFQSYSNTYVAIERLREVLAVVDAFVDGSHDGEVLRRRTRRVRDVDVSFRAKPATIVDSPSAETQPWPPVVAVSIATRPDTISDEALAVLEELASRIDVWLELGLESASDQVLRDIRRFHTLADFEEAVHRAKQAGLLTVGHAILGLPGDGREGAHRTADALAHTRVDGIKVHNLMVLRRTQMEKSWRAGEIATLDIATYVHWLADFVERLRPEQVIHRASADAQPNEQLAPDWRLHANEIRERLARELHARGTQQGSKSATSPVQPDQAASDRSAQFQPSAPNDSQPAHGTRSRANE